MSKAKYYPKYPYLIKGNFDNLPKEPNRNKVNKDLKEAKDKLTEWSKKKQYE